MQNTNISIEKNIKDEPSKFDKKVKEMWDLFIITSENKTFAFSTNKNTY